MGRQIPKMFSILFEKEAHEKIRSANLSKRQCTKCNLKLSIHSGESKKPFSIIESDDLMQFFLFFFGQRNFTIILQLLAPIYAKRFVKYEVQFTGSLYAM